MSHYGHHERSSSPFRREAVDSRDGDLVVDRVGDCGCERLSCSSDRERERESERDLDGDLERDFDRDLERLGTRLGNL